MKRWHYLVVTAVVSILEISFLPFLSQRVPTLGLLFAVLVALKVNPSFGMITGVLAGAIIDISFGFGIPQMALTYGVISYAIGLLSKHLIDLGAFTYLLTTLVATVVSILLATFFSLAFSYSGWQLVLDLKSIGLTMVANLVAALLIYILIREKLPTKD